MRYNLKLRYADLPIEMAVNSMLMNHKEWCFVNLFLTLIM